MIRLLIYGWLILFIDGSICLHLLEQKKYWIDWVQELKLGGRFDEKYL